MTGAEIRTGFLEFFRSAATRSCPARRSCPTSDPTLLFTNAGMVQFKNIFLGLQTPRQPARRELAEMPAPQRQAQRPRRGRPRHLPPHLLRDARQLVVRRLLQARGDRLGVGAAHRACGSCRRTSSGPRFTAPTTRPRALLAQARPTSARTTSCASARRTISGRWARPARAARARRSTSTAARAPATCSTSPATSAPSTPAARASSSCGTWSSSSTTAPTSGELEELAAKHVDTGMGLERVAAVLQGVPLELRHRPASATSSASPRSMRGKRVRRRRRRRPRRSASSPTTARALSFMVADGVLPSNDGRGYVLRRVLRRAARHAQQLGFDEPFLYRVTEAGGRHHGRGVSGARRAPRATSKR